jgi:hypothetical protein
VRLHDAFRDAETETLAAGLLRPRAIHTKERLKEARHVAFGDARTIIPDTDNDALAILSRGDLDGAAVGQEYLMAFSRRFSQNRAKLFSVDIDGISRDSETTRTSGGVCLDLLPPRALCRERRGDRLLKPCVSCATLSRLVR